MFFEQYSHEPYVATPRFIVKHLPPEHARRAELPDRLAKGRAALAVMETHLASASSSSRERYTIADIALYAYTHVAHEGGHDLAAVPAACAWLARVAAQPRYVELTARRRARLRDRERCACARVCAAGSDRESRSAAREGQRRAERCGSRSRRATSRPATRPPPCATRKQPSRSTPTYSAGMEGAGPGARRRRAMSPARLTAFRRGIEVADARGDRQAAKEMQVFLRRVEKRAGVRRRPPRRSGDDAAPRCLSDDGPAPQSSGRAVIAMRVIIAMRVRAVLVVVASRGGRLVGAQPGDDAEHEQRRAR